MPRYLGHPRELSPAPDSVTNPSLWGRCQRCSRLSPRSPTVLTDCRLWCGYCHIGVRSLPLGMGQGSGGWGVYWDITEGEEGLSGASCAPAVSEASPRVAALQRPSIIGRLSSDIMDVTLQQIRAEMEEFKQVRENCSSASRVSYCDGVESL